MTATSGPMAFALSLLGLFYGACVAAGPPEKPAAAKALIEKLLATRDPAEQARSLTKALGHEEWKIRESATRRLIAIGEPARPFLERAAESDDPEIRLRARRVLAAPRKPPPDVSAELGQAIDRLAAANDTCVLDALVALLDHHRVDVRYAAEYGLRRLTRHSFGYSAYAKEGPRAAAAKRWRSWWAKTRPTFAFARQPAPRPMPAGLVFCLYQKPQVLVLGLRGNLLRHHDVKGSSYCATGLRNAHVLLSDFKAGVVEEYDREGKLVWTTEGLKLINCVSSVQRLPNGNTLIAHLDGFRVIEVDADHKIVWTYHRPHKPRHIQSAKRLPSGNTLVTLSFPGNVVEITRAGKVVWESGPLNLPSHTTLLPNGRFLIAELSAKRVIEMTRDRRIVWERKCLGSPNSACRLPDGTTVISDYTEGLILVDKDGRLLRQLHPQKHAGKVSLLPATRPVPTRK